MLRAYYSDGLFWYGVTDPDVYGEGEVRFDHEPTEEELIAAFPNYLAARAQMINQQNRELRAAAYREESDPLFFKAQRGEATMEEWLAKVEEIKNRWSDQ